MTPEEMQALILTQKEELETLKLSNATALADSTAKAVQITDLQLHNQKLFLKLTAEPEKKKEEETQLTPEEFALTMKL